MLLASYRQVRGTRQNGPMHCHEVRRLHMCLLKTPFQHNHCWRMSLVLRPPAAAACSLDHHHHRRPSLRPQGRLADAGSALLGVVEVAPRFGRYPQQY